ncbi:MAG: hypothetical protein HZB43_11635 [candidate division Zixibacteria bacterium]|nr:hypothetical protein [candidate division Zixibacteria bacterium]
MMPARIGAAAVVGALVVFAACSCSETNYINQPSTDVVHLSGTVWGWYCGVGDLINNPRDLYQRRFSVRTGEPATIVIIRDNGFTSTIRTNDSSDFDLYVTAGAHKIVVKTGYSWPPDTTFNVQLRPGDTTLMFDIVYAVADPLNINCVFQYRSIDDTVGIRAEWDAIMELNWRTYGHRGDFTVFDIRGNASPGEFREVYQSEFTSTVGVYYRMPIRRSDRYHGEVYNVIEADEILQEIISADTTGFLGDHFFASPAGFYLCKDAHHD